MAVKGLIFHTVSSSVEHHYSGAICSTLSSIISSFSLSLFKHYLNLPPRPIFSLLNIEKIAVWFACVKVLRVLTEAYTDKE